MTSTVRALGSLAACAALACGAAYAQTPLGGDVATNRNLTAAASPYLVTSNLVIRSGAILSAEAGVTIRVSAGASITVEDGALRLLGTPAARVVVTSANDLPSLTPAPGDWGPLRFGNGTRDDQTLLQNVDLRYGSGVTIEAASPQFQNVAIRSMSEPAIRIDFASSPFGAGNTASGNALDAIVVPSGEAPTIGAWRLRGIPYYVEGRITVGRAPAIGAISPFQFERDDDTAATIAGTRLDGALSATVSGTGVTVTIEPGQSGTSIPVRVITAPDAPLGERTLCVDVAAGQPCTALQVVPPRPAITSIAPPFALVGDGDTTLAITGRKFVAGSIVRADGDDLATTFVDTTRLTAILPSARLAAPATMGISVANPDPLQPGNFLVSLPQPFVVHEPVGIASIVPDRGERSSTVNATIGGQGLDGATAVTFSGTGVTATISAGGTASSLPVRVSIAADAAVGPRTFCVTTPYGSDCSEPATFTVTGVVPVLDTIVPPDTVAGSAAFTLTANGSRFEPGAEILFDGTPIPTNRIGSTQLTGTVPADAIVTPGVVPVTVCQPDPLVVGGSLCSGARNFTIKTPAITLAPDPIDVIAGESSNLVLSIPNPAPAGGLVFDVVSSNTAVATVPSTVTVAAGQNSVPVPVTGVARGSSTVTASRTGYVSGSSVANVVPPPVFFPVTPLQATTVGVRVGTAPPAGPQLVVDPRTAFAVGVVRGAAVVALVPASAQRGTQNLEVTAQGAGLAGVTSVSFEPAAGITLVSGPVAAPDGRSVRFTISIDAAAATTWRTVLLRDANGAVRPASRLADRFLVTLLLPELTSVEPREVAPGADFTMTLRGRFLDGATSVDAVPPDGLTIVQPPVVSGGGTVATVRVLVAAGAPLGPRAMTITTPAGTSSSVPSPFNTLNVVAQVGPAVTPLTAPSVGVRVEVAPAGPKSLDVRSLPATTVGVIRGTAVTSLVPAKANVGTTLDVAVRGAGLAGTTDVGFEPATGITVNGPPVASPDGTRVTVNITVANDNSLVGWRVVRVITPNGRAMPASRDADRFRVTLPEPEIASVEPIRGLRGASTSMTIRGRNLTGATSVALEPPAGATFDPPVVNADGTVVTTRVTLAADAALGLRVVRVTAPGGTSTDVPSPANTFEVTDQAGFPVTPLVARTVGVRVALPPPPTPTLTVQPVVAPGVGVRVVAAPDATPPFPVTPLAARPVGVLVGATVTGVSPTAGAPGTGSLDVTVSGVSLGDTQSVQIVPADGVTVNGAPTVAPDGRSVTFNVSISAAAPRGARRILLRNGANAVIPAAGRAADVFYVGAPPVILSLVPNVKAVGDSFTLTINGTAFDGLLSVAYVPPDDVLLGFPTLVSPTQITIPVTIKATATPGARIVIVTTFYGTSSPEATPANTFTIVGTLAEVPPTDAARDETPRVEDGGAPEPVTQGGGVPEEPAERPPAPPGPAGSQVSAPATSHGPTHGEERIPTAAARAIRPVRNVIRGGDVASGPGALDALPHGTRGRPPTGACVA